MQKFSGIVVTWCGALLVGSSAALSEEGMPDRNLDEQIVCVSGEDVREVRVDIYNNPANEDEDVLSCKSFYTKSGQRVVLWSSEKSGEACSSKAHEMAAKLTSMRFNCVTMVKGGLPVENAQKAVPRTSVADKPPTRLHECVKTKITGIHPRGWAKGAKGAGPDDYQSGTIIEYSNGVAGVSYDIEETIINTAAVGDSVSLCLVAIPDYCPPGNQLGWVYEGTDQRTGLKWALSNSAHGC
jgi:hypothetical protein